MLMSSFDQGAFDRDRTRSGKASAGRRDRDIAAVLATFSPRSTGQPLGPVRAKLEIAMKAKGVQINRTDLDELAAGLVAGEL